MSVPPSTPPDTGAQRTAQAGDASQTLVQQSMETPLRKLLRGAPVGVSAATPLGEALQLMHDRHTGSVLVLDAATGGAEGMLTRHDILGRFTCGTDAWRWLATAMCWTTKAAACR